MKAVVALLLAAASPAVLYGEELILRWKEVPHSLVDGRTVEVRLIDGSTLRGRAVAVNPEGLRMEVTKVHGGAGNYGKGETTVPALEITQVKVNRTGVRGRIAGASIGGGISGVLLGTAVAITHNEGTNIPPGIAAGMLAPAAIGYHLGWARDHHIATIHVVREGPIANSTDGAAPQKTECAAGRRCAQ